MQIRFIWRLLTDVRAFILGHEHIKPNIPTALKKRVFVYLQYMSLSRRICQYQKVQYWQLWGKYIQPVDSLQYDNLVTCFVISSLYCIIWPHKLKIIQKYKIIKIIPPLRNGPPDLLWLSADHWEGDWCDTGFSKSPEPTINGLG